MTEGVCVMGFFYGRIYTTSLAKKSGTTPKVNQQVIPLVTSQKKKQRKRCTAFIYIVQVFQLTFSPNVTLYYLSSYDVINLLCLYQNTMHGALL